MSISQVEAEFSALCSFDLLVPVELSQTVIRTTFLFLHRMNFRKSEILA